MRPKIASFDVFDTVITRCVARPTDLFAYIPKHLGIEIPGFSLARVAAEQFCYRQSGHATLDEIYSGEGGFFQLDRAVLEQCKEMEIFLEQELLYPIEPIIKRIHQARQQGLKIAFLSDMYLSAKVLTKMLSKAGAYVPGDYVLVSGEQRASKRSGDLFRVLMRIADVASAEIQHTGNDFDADYRSPQKLGISAVHFEQGNLTYRERVLAAQASDENPWCSILAAVSRQARIETIEGNPHELALHEIAADVVGPVLSAYVIWVLNKAVEDNVQVLYFVSRDGYQMVSVARSLAKALNLDIEIRYLYGSRQAWHLPAITNIDSHVLSWLLEKTPNLTLQRLLARGGLCIEETIHLFADYGLSAEKERGVLNDKDVVCLEAAFTQSVELQRLLLSRAAIKRQEALAYLREEGFSTSKKKAIVDLGWRGRLQISLNNILHQGQLEIVSGYYFGLITSPRGAGPYRTYAFSPDHLQDMHLPFITLLESFFTAPHGSTTGYLVEDGKIKPVLNFECNETNRWGVRTVCHATECYGKLLAQTVPYWPKTPLIFRDIEAHLRQFIQKPTQKEAMHWGLFPFKTDQIDGSTFLLAYPFEINIQNCWRSLRYGMAPVRHAYSWVRGCHRLTPSWYSCLLRVLTGLSKAFRINWSS